MAGLVVVKTMGSLSTHSLSQHIHTHAQTHSHIPLVHFKHMVNKKIIILMGAAVGEGDTGNSIWLFYVSHCQQMYLSCR